MLTRSIQLITISKLGHRRFPAPPLLPRPFPRFPPPRTPFHADHHRIAARLHCCRSATLTIAAAVAPVLFFQGVALSLLVDASSVAIWFRCSGHCGVLERL